MKILQGLYDEFVTKMSTINQNKTEAFCCLAFDVDQKNHRHLKADMGNPTVGLVYYTATLHYNCSFKSSLPYIATLL